ncbi:MAG: hypothetical protein IKB58_05065, partial [Oscillospiraceae bacterium]|nr:hypothetical protein [Oscillospiraceae bacterium]
MLPQSAVKHLKRFFLFHRQRRIFFFFGKYKEKENGGLKQSAPARGKTCAFKEKRQSRSSV